MVITGTSSGLGKATAKALLRAKDARRVGEALGVPEKVVGRGFFLRGDPNHK